MSVNLLHKIVELPLPSLRSSRTTKGCNFPKSNSFNKKRTKKMRHTLSYSKLGEYYFCCLFSPVRTLKTVMNDLYLATVNYAVLDPGIVRFFTLEGTGPRNFWQIVAQRFRVHVTLVSVEIYCLSSKETIFRQLLTSAAFKRP